MSTDACVEFLRELLAAGPQLARLIQVKARIAGHSARTVDRARRRAGIQARKVSVRGGWEWSLPGMEKAKSDVVQPEPRSPRPADAPKETADLGISTQQPAADEAPPHKELPPMEPPILPRFTHGYTPSPEAQAENQRDWERFREQQRATEARQREQAAAQQREEAKRQAESAKRWEALRTDRPAVMRHIRLQLQNQPYWNKVAWLERFYPEVLELGAQEAAEARARQREAEDANARRLSGINREWGEAERVRLARARGDLETKQLEDERALKLKMVSSPGLSPRLREQLLAELYPPGTTQQDKEREQREQMVARHLAGIKGAQ